MKKQIIAEIAEMLQKSDYDLVMAIYNTLRRMRGGSIIDNQRKDNKTAR